MKVNLIYDMRSGFSDNFDSYTNEERGEAVLAVLESSRHATEQNKIIAGLETKNREIQREIVKINDLLVGNQLNQWNILKISFGIY